MISDALISECGQYRYWLRRQWTDITKPKTVVFIGVNPSTADATEDDPTIRRCIKFSQRWGGDALLMLNLFAFRATDPNDMKAQGPAAVGPENNRFLTEFTGTSFLTVAAWGVNGEFRQRDQRVVQMLDDGNLFCLGFTKDGHPRHPLYVRADTLLQPLVAF